MTNIHTPFPTDLVLPEELEAAEYAHALDEIVGREYYITQKHEGTAVVYARTSAGFAAYDKNGSIPPSSPVWKIASQYEIENLLRDYYLGQNVALYGVVDSNNELFVHGIFFIEEQMFATYSQLWTFCNDLGVPMVNLVDKGDKFQYSMEYLAAMASKLKYKGKSTPGLVVRVQWPLRSAVLNKEWSLKVSNANYQKS